MLALQMEATGSRIAKLEPKQYHNTLIDALTEIKLISGAIIYPDGTPDQKAQVHVLKNFIARTPRYQLLTMAEITQAFYMNFNGTFGEPCRHYNRELNAEFMGDVLNAYCRWKDRFMQEKIGAINRALLGPGTEEKPVITTDTWRGEILRDLHLIRTENEALIFNTSRKYKVLRSEGYIRLTSRTMWWRWYVAALEEKQAKAIKLPARTDGQAADRTRILRILEAALERGEIPREEHPSNVAAARRYVYLEYLHAFNDCGITDPFTQVLPCWCQ